MNYTEKQLVFVGLLFLLLGGYLATLFNGRLDGVIDMHFVEKVTFLQSYGDLLISIVTVTLLLFALGKYINTKTRFIDMVTTGLISKIPFYFLLFFNINNTVFTITEKLMNDAIPKGKTPNLALSDMIILIALSIVTLLFLVWSIVLLFNGFKTATNAKGSKQIILFAITILISEIISKILISILN